MRLSACEENFPDALQNHMTLCYCESSTSTCIAVTRWIEPDLPSITPLRPLPTPVYCVALQYFGIGATRISLTSQKFLVKRNSFFLLTRLCDDVWIFNAFAYLYIIFSKILYADFKTFIVPYLPKISGTMCLELFGLVQNYLPIEENLKTVVY